MRSQARRRHHAPAQNHNSDCYVSLLAADQQNQASDGVIQEQHKAPQNFTQGAFNISRSLVPSQSAAALYQSGTQLVSQFSQGTTYFVNSLYQLTDDPVETPPDYVEQNNIADSENLQPIPWSEVLGQKEMPCRERTLEFRAAAKSHQMRIAAAPVVKPSTALLQRATQFNSQARQIGSTLSHTCAKLQRLAVLAKSGRTGMNGLGASASFAFDDEAAMAETEQLAHAIKQDITGLNGQIGKLQENLVTSHVGPAQGQTHSKSVIVGLQSRLATVSTEFKQLLELRSENVKSMQSRRDRFSTKQAVPSSLPPSASTGHMGSVLLYSEATQQQERQRDARQRRQLGPDGLPPGEDDQVALDMSAVELTRSQQQTLLVDEQHNYLRARDVAMETVESSIAELGQIFRQLAHLVSEQGETIQRIDSHVEQTSLNVESAHMELLKYFRSISNNRWLAMKVFGVLLILFVFFIVFMT